MIPLSWLSVSGLKSVISKIWPYLVAIVATTLLYLFVQYKWNHSMAEQYHKGLEDGKQEVAKNYANEAAKLKEKWSLDKDELEDEAQQRIRAAKADADKSRVAANSLQRTLDQIRSVASGAGVSVSSGTSTSEAVNLLADLLEQSNERANGYAEFADSTFEAGRSCEIQYNKMRSRVIEQASK